MRAYWLLFVIGFAFWAACDPVTDSEDSPVPVLTSVSPPTVTAGSDPMDVTLTGTGFVPETRARVWGDYRSTAGLGEGSLTVRLRSEDLATPRTLELTVHTPPPGGGVSNSLPLVVEPSAPRINELQPTSADAGSGETVLVILGAWFQPDDVVRWDGQDLPTAYSSDTRLEAQLAPALLAKGGRHAVTIYDPGHDATSPPMEFVVWNAVPRIESVDPGHTFAGEPELTLTVRGAGFVSGAMVLWNGEPRPATVISPELLEAKLGASELAAAGKAMIGVENPDPAPTSSNTSQLRILDPSQYVLPVVSGGVAADTVRGLLYVSVLATDQKYANRVVAVDPLTANIVGSVFVGSDPGHLAISDDASVLYVSVDGAASVRRVHLATLTAGLQFAIRTSAESPLHVNKMEVPPGTPGTVAMTYRVRRCNQLGCWYGLEQGVGVYDNGVLRGVESNHGTVLTFSAADTLYTYDGGSTAARVCKYALSPTGPVHVNEWERLVYGFYHDIAHVNGLIFSTGGTVVNPAQGALIANLPVYGALGVDASRARVFYMQADTLAVVDVNALEVTGTEAFDGVPKAPVTGTLVRWGEDGVAYLSDSTVVVLRSPLVAP